MIMIRLLVLTLSIAAASWPSAHACSPGSRAGVQDYYAISSNARHVWDIENMSVGLIYAKQKGREHRDIFNYRGDGNEKKPFVKMQYKLIEDISGGFMPDEKKWIPEITEAVSNNLLKLKTTGRSFAFWDRSDLGVALITGYKGGTSCGPLPSETLLPNQFYLQFKKDDHTIGMEIVSGPEDELVADWRKIYTGKKETKINRNPKSYFAKMSGYQKIELEKCPTKDEITLLHGGGSAIFSGPVDIDVESIEPENIFRQYSFHNSDIKKLNVTDLLAYQKMLNGREWQCEAGKRYLVLDKLSRRTYRGYSGMFNLNPPEHRYVEITNGTIDTKDILSHITILPNADGNTEVSVAQVKNWIHEANPN